MSRYATNKISIWNVQMNEGNKNLKKGTNNIAHMSHVQQQNPEIAELPTVTTARYITVLCTLLVLAEFKS